jgi:hypothetical protein
MEDFEDVELETAAPAQSSQVDDKSTNSEPSLVIGQDVFRNRQRLLEKRRMIAIVLGAIATLFLISTITLAVLYGKLLRHGHSPVEPVTTTTILTVHHTTTYSRRTPATTTSTSSVVATSSNSLPEIQVITVTASTTNIAISPATPQPTQCWPGSVWGGADLKDVNEGYAVLMSVALSRSQVGRMGLATDYDLVAMRSIFLCGMSMAPGELQLLDICKAAYVSQGETTRCDESGSELSAR